jgi:hypothetical protein
MFMLSPAIPLREFLFRRLSILISYPLKNRIKNATFSELQFDIPFSFQVVRFMWERFDDSDVGPNAGKENV